jgi:glucose-1-phosphate cytidylyltransferase
MKSIILAGGFGSRLEEITKIIPKPLVKLRNIPILIHVLKIFVKHNKKDFIIALGYKGEKIVEYFIKKKNY